MRSHRRTDEGAQHEDDEDLAALDSDNLVDLYVRGRTGAFGEIWRRHYARMLTMANRGLRAFRSLRRLYEADDAVSDAVGRLTERALRGGLIGRISSSNEFWLFFRDVLRQCIRDEHRRRLTAKRRGDVPKGDARNGGFQITSHGQNFDTAANLELIASVDPGPEVTVLMEDIIRRLFELLNTEQQLVARLRLGDRSVREIAELTRLSERTIARRLEQIRRVWGRSGLLDGHDTRPIRKKFGSV